MVVLIAELPCAFGSPRGEPLWYRGGPLNRRCGEVCRAGAEGSVHVPRYGPGAGECGAEDQDLGWGVVTDQRDRYDQGCDKGDAQRDAPVKAPASEWGQGSMFWTISLPSSESVQSVFEGQRLQIWGLPR
jgi:hypothetical protein